MRWWIFLTPLSLGVAAVYSTLPLLNFKRWSINAALQPVSKDFNESLYPLASAWWTPSSGFNVAFYLGKFMPGRPEQYDVDILAPRDYGLPLDGYAQITPSQTAGSYAPTPAAPRLTSTANNRYSILMKAAFNKVDERRATHKPSRGAYV